MKFKFNIFLFFTNLKLYYQLIYHTKLLNFIIHILENHCFVLVIKFNYENLNFNYLIYLFNLCNIINLILHESLQKILLK